MAQPVFYYLGFLISISLIVVSGSRLSKYGDIIAEHKGWGKAWVGLIMVAAITSLPELVTGASAILFVDAPDIAVGDIMGSSAFNLLILAVLDYFVPGKPLSAVVTKGHVLAGFFGIFQITLAVITIVFGDFIPVIGWVSSTTIIMIGVYFISVRIIFKHEQNTIEDTRLPASDSDKKPELISLSVAARRYVLYALLVVLSATLLPFFADYMAGLLGLSKSFVGTLLVAASTSLPELVVSIAAVRIGSMDIAVGNLLGSNIFNMLILSIDDFLFVDGALLNAADPTHALSGMVTLLMTAVVGISILFNKPPKRFHLGIDAIILVLLYILLMTAIYLLT
jgi:cation:H+ antiporter